MSITIRMPHYSGSGADKKKSRNVGANKPAAAADSHGPRVLNTSMGQPEYGKLAHRSVFQNGQIHLIGVPQFNFREGKLLLSTIETTWVHDPGYPSKKYIRE